jgi:hypothetical protein
MDNRKKTLALSVRVIFFNKVFLHIARIKTSRPIHFQNIGNPPPFFFFFFFVQISNGN